MEENNGNEEMTLKKKVKEKKEGRKRIGERNKQKGKNNEDIIK